MTDYKTLTAGGVSIGDKLEPADIDITTGLVVCGALATRDFEPVHHNKAEAQATGLPDVDARLANRELLRKRLEGLPVDRANATGAAPLDNVIALAQSFAAPEVGETAMMQPSD